MPAKQKLTYDFICFSNLAYEFDGYVSKTIDKKIKKQLKYHQLGDYNQERIDYIRTLKDDLKNEIGSHVQSKYYTKSNSEFTEIKDFNIEQMKVDYLKKYPKIEVNELMDILYFAVYLYHAR